MSSLPGLSWPESVVAVVGAAVAAAAVTTAFLLDPAVPAASAGPAAADGASAPRDGDQGPGRTLDPADFGAVGDGVADDTTALQAALDELGSGDTLVLAAGRTYRHDDVLLVRRPGSRLVGPGELLASDEERSSLQLQADGVRLHGVGLRITGTSRRWTGLAQHRLVLGRHDGIVVAAVRVDGAAGAGVYVEGATRFLLADLTVTGTRADGIHMTGGARDGVVRRPTLERTGDDGVAVVSYQADPAVTSDITVESPRVERTTGGRGVSVVGGRDVVFRDVRVTGSFAAAVYLATEGAPYFTRSTERVAVLGGSVTGANTSSRVDHGAVLVSAAAAGTHVHDVRVVDLTIRGTRAAASRQVGVLSYDAEVRRVELTGLRVWGGGPVFQSTAGAGAVTAVGWTVDGLPHEPGT